MRTREKDLGCVYFSGWIIGGLTSVYNEVLTDNKLIQLESGMGDIRYCTIGDINHAYEILRKNVKSSESLSFHDLCFLVCDTVWNYFGNVSNIKTRLDYFPTEEDVIDNKNGKISDLMGKNAAMCVERASVAHNLLKSININSSLKFSEIIIDSKKDIHCFNLIEYDNKYYLFDTALVMKQDDKVSPLLVEIPHEYYEYFKQDIRGKSEYAIQIDFAANDLERQVTYMPSEKNLIKFDLRNNDKKKSSR